MPPEALSMDNEKPFSMKGADVWALGVIIYVLAFNKLPFKMGEDMTEFQLMELIS